MSTLADAIVGQKGSRIDDAMRGAYTALSSKILEAQRFVFSPDAVAACEQLEQSRPSSLLDATKFCRVPFEHVWMEWGARSSVEKEYWPAKHKADIDEPRRMGCLIECLDNTFKRFGITYIWQFSEHDIKNRYGRSAVAEEITKGGAINICPFGFIVNWHDQWMPKDLSQTISEIRSSAKHVEFRDQFKKFKGDLKEEAAAIELLANRIPVQVPSCKAFVESLTKMHGFMGMEQLTKASARDLEGEYFYVIAMLCLLSARNCVSQTPSDLERLNKARRRRGKLPLLSHSTVTINLSRSDAARAGRVDASAIEMRQHIVRGHFKIRSGGVYWWRPFLRGNADVGVIKRDGYRVVNRPTVPSSEKVD